MHLVHDCSWGGNYCRCIILQTVDVLPRSRSPLWTASLSNDYWCNLLYYLHQFLRELLYCELSSREREVLMVGEVGHGDAEEPEHSLDRLLEGDGPLYDICNGWSGGSNLTAFRKSDRIDGQKDKSRKPTGFHSIEEELLGFVKNFACAPLKAIVDSNAWFQSKYKWKPLNWETLTIVLNNFAHELIQMSTLDFIKFYEGGNPLFRTPAGSTSYYLSLERSYDICSDLLLYQFEGEIDRVKDFVSSLYCILDKKYKKMNCMQIVGEPSSGKIFFFDCVTDFYLSISNIGNFNRTSGFPLNDCKSKRVLIWNEPILSPDMTDQAKMILGGDNMNIKVKYQNDATLTRTPVIILTNKNVIPKEIAFKDRVKTFHWKRAPFLKHVDAYPHPLVWVKLLDIFCVHTDYLEGRGQY
nr:MAG: non-structural protein NS1 [Pseudoscorpian denso-like virus]